MSYLLQGRERASSRVVCIGFVLFCMAVTLMLPVTAQGGTPFSLGKGKGPSLAVDVAGKTHVVFNDDDKIHYCQLEQGRQGCLQGRTFMAPGGDASKSFVLTTVPNTVYIVMPRYVQSDIQVWKSTNGGAPGSFTGPIEAATNYSGIHADDAMVGPGGKIFVSSTLGAGTFVQSFNPNGGPNTLAADLGNLPGAPGQGPYGYSTTLGLYRSQPGNTSIPIVAGWSIPNSGSHGTGFYRYRGDGNPNDEANWVGPTKITDGEEPRMASNPEGLFLLDQADRSRGKSYEVWRFDGTSFVDPVTLPGSRYGYEGNLFAVPAPNGNLYSVWRENGSPSELRIAMSSDGGKSFNLPLTIATSTGILSLTGASTPDGKGFVAWEGGDDAVSVVPIDPAALSASRPAEETPSGSDQNGSGNAQNSPIKQPVSNPKRKRSTGSYSGPVRYVTVRVGGTTYGLALPRRCVKQGQSVTLKVTQRTKRKLIRAKSAKRYKVKRVVFSVGKRKRTDKKAPFRWKVSTAKFAPKSKHSVKVKVSLRRIKGNRRVTKTLKGTLRICG